MYITEWCPVVPYNQITRLSFPNLMAALDAWEVEYSKNGRELRLRMKLDEAIVEYQPQKTAKKQKDQKDDAVASVPSVCLAMEHVLFHCLRQARRP